MLSNCTFKRVVLVCPFTFSVTPLVRVNKTYGKKTFRSIDPPEVTVSPEEP